MKIYTIGFTQKNAKEFFGTLNQNNVNLLIDIRANPKGQLSGFAKKEDLPYLLDKLNNHCKYIHLPVLTPTKELLKTYRLDKNWSSYSNNFEKLMDERHVPEVLDELLFKTNQVCLLCSEVSAEKCHRRLVAERLSKIWADFEVIHL